MTNDEARYIACGGSKPTEWRKGGHEYLWVFHASDDRWSDVCYWCGVVRRDWRDLRRRQRRANRMIRRQLARLDAEIAAARQGGLGVNLGYPR